MDDSNKNHNLPENISNSAPDHTSDKNNLNSNIPSIEFDRPFIFGEDNQSPPASTNNNPSLNELNSMPPQKLYKTKSHAKLITAIIAIIMVLILGTLALTLRGTLINTLSLATKSPADYYKSLERKEIDKTVSSILSLKPYSKKETALNLSSTLTYDRKTVAALLTQLGISLEDTETLIGVPINQIGIDMIVAQKEETLQEKILFSLNQVDLISLEVLFDYITGELLLRSPELSKAYLKYSKEEETPLVQLDSLLLQLMQSDQTGTILKKYSSIILDNLNRVDLNQNSEFKTDQVYKKCNQLTVTLDLLTLNQIGVDLLEEAISDPFIHELLPSLGITKEDYIQHLERSIAAGQEQVENVPTYNYDFLKIIIYVDSSGHIIGREFVNVLRNGNPYSKLGYYSLYEKGVINYGVYQERENINLFYLIGNNKPSGKYYDGSLTMSINGKYYNLNSDFVFDIDYKNIRRIKKNNQWFYYGNLTVSSHQMMGMRFLVDFDVVDEVQTSQIRLQFGSSSLFTLSSKLKYLQDYPFDNPSTTEDVYDFSKWNDFLQTIDLDTFLQQLQSQLGINIEDFILNYFY